MEKGEGGRMRGLMDEASQAAQGKPQKQQSCIAQFRLALINQRLIAQLVM